MIKGDRVKLVTSVWGDSENNPIWRKGQNIGGTFVLNRDGCLPIFVEWDNGFKNFYDPEDLKLLGGEDWKALYYPTPALFIKFKSTIVAITHSLLKWRGLRDLSRFNLKLSGGAVRNQDGSTVLQCDAKSCSLCVKFLNPDIRPRTCSECPLSQVRGEPCDYRERNIGRSPFWVFLQENNPEPMIALLEKALKREQAAHAKAKNAAKRRKVRKAREKVKKERGLSYWQIQKKEGWYADIDNPISPLLYVMRTGGVLWFDGTQYLEKADFSFWKTERFVKVNAKLSVNNV